VFQIMSDKRWRRVVASPQPQRLVEEEPLLQVIQAGHVVIASGGGGVPVVEESGQLRGVEAVVDKDRTAARLARRVDADVLLVLTDVAVVQAGFGTPEARPLRRLSAGEARELLAAGEFPEGSMGPKVSAACDFVESGGRRAVITDLASAGDAVFGDAGTQLTA
ncbi:MAG TPA: carbamate kinase, partial [Mycobacteriales bacterium]|nr:carbamate kinase [Mycobacteriales bacterium]